MGKGAESVFQADGGRIRRSALATAGFAAGTLDGIPVGDQRALVEPDAAEPEVLGVTRIGVAGGEFQAQSAGHRTSAWISAPLATACPDSR